MQAQLCMGECFYYGLCEPRSETETAIMIRETINYIEDAERLADN